MAFVKPRELLGHPESRMGYNVVGNDERECLKTMRIGQSAAKPPRNGWKVQRLLGVAQTGRNGHERGGCSKSNKI